MTAPEFLDDPAAGDEREDLLDTAEGRRVPPWLIAIAVGALAFVAVVVALHHDNSGSKPTAAPQPSRTVPFAPPPSPNPAMRGLNGTVLEVFTRAHDNEPAQDIVRTGSEATQCKGVRIGSIPPQTTAARALSHGLPGFRIRDAARILDQNAGLCALQVRGRNNDGAVIVLTVTSPTVGAAAARAVFHQADARVQSEVVRYVQLRTSVGWVVTLGAVGPERDLPDKASLASAARNTALRW